MKPALRRRSTMIKMINDDKNGCVSSDRVAGCGAADLSESGPGHPAGVRRGAAGAARLHGGVLARVGADRVSAVLPAAGVPVAAARERALAGDARAHARGGGGRAPRRQRQPPPRARARAAEDARRRCRPTRREGRSGRAD